MDRKNIIIYVAGQRFSIRTKDTEEYVISTGEQVDLRIKGIQNDNPRLNRDACAILAALDYCDDMRKLSSRVDILRDQVKDYLADSERLRSENAALKSETQKLRAEIETLKAQKNTPAKNHKPEQNKKNSGTNSGVPFANPPQQSQRYGVQSYSSSKEAKPQTNNNENYHQFSIFDKEIKG